MKKQLIIGLVGLSNSGKGEVVNAITDLSCNIIGDTVEVAFGDALKDICKELFELPRKELTSINLFHDKSLREHSNGFLGGKTPRQVLQEVGEALRGIVENVWVNPVKNELLDAIETGNSYADVIVVSDIRYENELQMLLNLAIAHGDKVIVELWNIKRDVISRKYQYYIGQLFEFYNNDIDVIKPQVEQLLLSNKLPVKYAHESELNYWILKRLCNRHIDNNGDLEQLRDKILVILDDINKYNN